MLYVNTGDFVESCTAIAEHEDGAFEILRWHKTAAEREAAEAAERAKCLAPREPRRPDANPGRDGRLASAGQWRRPIARNHGAGGARARRRDRLPDAADFCSLPDADLSGNRAGARHRRAPCADGSSEGYDHVHIATEGPIGLATRAVLPARRAAPSPRAFTRASPNISTRASACPSDLTYAALRRFHNAGAGVMVSTPSLARELVGARLSPAAALVARRRPRRCFSRSGDHARPAERPIFLYAGRLAVEKNIEAFLALDLPGTKLVAGDGPGARRRSRRDFRRPISSATRRAPNSRRSTPAIGRLRLSEPHRHLRHRAARSAGLRPAGRRLSGHGTARCHRRERRRRAERGSAAPPRWPRSISHARPRAPMR